MEDAAGRLGAAYVARHFFGPDFVKRYIDMLARYKINRFHWHLTEDQGWRIPIDRYPRLTQVGAYRTQTHVGHGRDDFEDIYRPLDRGDFVGEPV